MICDSHAISLTIYSQSFTRFSAGSSPHTHAARGGGIVGGAVLERPHQRKLDREIFEDCLSVKIGPLENFHKLHEFLYHFREVFEPLFCLQTTDRRVDRLSQSEAVVYSRAIAAGPVGQVSTGPHFSSLVACLASSLSAIARRTPTRGPQAHR